MIKIRNKKGPKTDPRGTLTLIFFQLDDCPLRTTRYCLSVKNNSRRQNIELSIALHMSSQKSPNFA